MEQLTKNSIENNIAELFRSGNPTPFQDKCFKIFEEKGFPGKKDEEYKFTPLKSLFSKSLENLTVGSKASINIPDGVKYNEEGHHLFFVNGEYDASLSIILQDDISISEIENIEEQNTVANADSEVLVALNNAFANGGILIDAPRNKAGKTIFIYHVIDNSSQAILASPRIRVKAEVGSELKIIEKTTTTGEVNSYINRVTEISVENNASVNYTKIQKHHSSVFDTDGLFVDQTKDSRFYANTFTFGGGVVRNNLNINLNEEHCETHMHGLYLLTGKSHVDNHTTVDHKKANSFSNEMYKGIVDDRSTGVFNGKIFVRPNAQQTNAFQSNNNISLSETANLHTKPQLEIWADDVKCSHGCTIGQLDEEAVFYLRARGIGEKKAKALLLVAFAEASFEFLPFEFIREELHQTIEDRLL